MAGEKTEERKPVSEWALWFGLLGAPIAWIIRLGISYPLVPVLCRADSTLLLHVVSIAFLAICVAAVLVAWRSYRILRRENDAPMEPWLWERTHFMALVGIFISGLFALTIATEWLAAFFTHPCTVR
jgi:hypothetical protein